MSDAELKLKGFELLSNHLGLVEMERFISLINEDKTDYTFWRKNLFEGLKGEEISRKAMELKKNYK